MLCVGALLACSACAPVFSSPVTVTTKVLPQAQVPAGAKLVRGTSCSRITLAIIPLGFGTADSAFRDALAQAPGTDTLLAWHTKTDILGILAPFIYAQSCVTVEGYAVDSRRLSNA